MIIYQSTIDSIDVDRSIAERRIRRPRRLPKRIRDMPPNLLAALPPSLLPPTSVLATPPSALPLPSTSTLPKSSTPLSSALSRVRKILKSTRNLFGLYRQYHATQFPEHDPDENVTFDDLMDTSADSSSSLPVSYSPYPTESSFLLGEWYWNDGVKKSQSSFNNLLKIVGHPDFRPEDVAGANWRRINAQLAEGVWGDGPNTGDCEDGWEDERVDGDWIKTPIKITVPFHKKTLNPGSEEFEAGMLYHRKLISVIREKISRPCSHPHLHFEPYELYWQPNETTEPVRTHGELYASDAFFDAHRALQDSPGEPGCQLPRVVVGLMFASDGTELTAFSNAKLWPVYLALGNESKNRRSKPSCQAFEHVAYFETVSTAFFALYAGDSNLLCDSSQVLSRPLHRSALAGRDQMARSWRIVTASFIMLSGRSCLTTNLRRHTCTAS